MDFTQNIALYRLPGDTHYYEISSERIETGDIAGCLSSGRSGFVFFPFEGEGIFLSQSEVNRRDFKDLDSLCVPQTPKASSTLFDSNNAAIPDAAYSNSFRAVHDAVAQGLFKKLVLARKRALRLDAAIDPEGSFRRACLLYPNMMVVLFHTPTIGTWLISTPELLLESIGGDCHTVALAGTMTREEHAAQGWSAKNTAEQEIVSDYICDTLKPYCANIQVEGPYTTEAGHLVHLKTDIRFKTARRSASASQDIGNIVAALHPTPAVCGLPAPNATTTSASAFLKAIEPFDRQFYSGFCGPVNVEGSTKLYMSLRCLKAGADLTSVDLFAGGGIMPGSECSSEFLETENKMQTIAKCIVTK